MYVKITDVLHFNLKKLYTYQELLLIIALNRILYDKYDCKLNLMHISFNKNICTSNLKYLLDNSNISYTHFEVISEDTYLNENYINMYLHYNYLDLSYKIETSEIKCFEICSMQNTSFLNTHFIGYLYMVADIIAENYIYGLSKKLSIVGDLSCEVYIPAYVDLLILNEYGNKLLSNYCDISNVLNINTQLLAAQMQYYLQQGFTVENYTPSEKRSYLKAHYHIGDVLCLYDQKTQNIKVTILRGYTIETFKVDVLLVMDLQETLDYYKSEYNLSCTPKVKFISKEYSYSDVGIDGYINSAMTDYIFGKLSNIFMLRQRQKNKWVDLNIFDFLFYFFKENEITYNKRLIQNVNAKINVTLLASKC